MKIVVDILEEDYKYFCNSSIRYDLKVLSKQNSKDIEGTLMILNLIDATKNGTPLPKGHGRLIDADELIKQLEATANIEWNMQVDSSKGLIDAIDIVDDVPTIIEADKESD